MKHTFEIDEGQRQMLVLAIAHLAIERPGWDWTLWELSKIFQAEAMYEEFKKLHSPRITMQIKIQPALQPLHQHKLQDVLQGIVEGVGKVDGGETDMTGAECSIFIYPLEGHTEDDLRERLTGTTTEPPWELPKADPATGIGRPGGPGPAVKDQSE